MNLELFKLKINNNNFLCEDAESLAIFLKERMEEGNEQYSRISDDDTERTLLVGLLLKKKESLGNSRFVRITEWREIGEDAVYFKMKSILEDMNVKQIIQSLTFALGGTAMFTIVERQDYVDYLHEEIMGVLEKIKKKEDEQAAVMTPSQEERDDSRILTALERFKRVIERDGYLLLARLKSR